MQNYKNIAKTDADWYSFGYERIPTAQRSSTPDDTQSFTSTIASSLSSDIRPVTPDLTRRMTMETSRGYSSRHSRFSRVNYSKTRLDKEEQRAYDQIMQGMSVDIDMLPKDPQHGKVVWFDGDYGCIRTLAPVLHLHEFYFHSYDCLREDGEEPTIRVGDRVFFNLSVCEKRLCAVNVLRMARRTVSSPDFSRLIPKHSIDISPLELFHVC